MRLNSICVLFLIVSCAFVHVAKADILTPTTARATSEFGEVEFLDVFSEIYVENLVNGRGLIDIEETPENVLDDVHDFDAFWNSGWHSGDFDAGIPGGLDDDGDPFTAPLVADQILEFEFGNPAMVTHAHIWQQNQSGLGASLSIDRGVEDFEMFVSAGTLGSPFTSVGTFSLDPEAGDSNAPAQVIELNEPVLAKRIRFNLISAFSGELREFVGLGEVRFEGEFQMRATGDFNGDGLLDAVDIDLLSTEVRDASNNLQFDLNADAIVDRNDRDAWVREIRRTFYGDSNLDGEFNSTDFVVVFQAGQYEDAVEGNSTWATGDWNGDSEFDSTDFVIAFQDGGFETGPRVLSTVPEPVGATTLLFGILFLGLFRKR